MLRLGLLVAALLLLAQTAAQAQDRPQLADMAARQSLALYKSGGLSALINNSQDCHKYLLDKIYCIYLDTTAYQIDQSFVKTMGGPGHPYFDTEQTRERFRPILTSSGMSVQQANDFLRLSFSLVELASERNADG